MRAAVDSDRCRGHGVCVSLCPQVFDLSEHGYAVVAEPNVPAEHEDAVAEAVRACPERAIETR